MSIARKSGLGGTDISAILGMHPQKDAFTVYAQKTGLLDDVINETNRRMRWGTKLQKVVAEAWSETTGKPHEWLDVTRRGKAAEWQLYTPDARSAAPGDRRGIEAKTAGLDQAKLWGDAGSSIIPDHYVIQCAWYMSADDAELWDIALLIAGNDFRIYTTHRDYELEGLLLERGDKFWRDHVLAGRPPAPGPMAADTLKMMFPSNREALRDATDHEATLLEDLRHAREKLADVQAEHDAIENAVKLAIGEADGLQYAGGRVTWKKQKDTIGPDWVKLAQELNVRLAAAREVVASAYRCAEWLQFGRTEKTDATAQDRADLQDLMLIHQMVTRVGGRTMRCDFVKAR